MSRRHHHPNNVPNTEYLTLSPLGEAMLDTLELETRARKLYELAEADAVAELNGDRSWGLPKLTPVEWADTDPDTRRDYRRQVLDTMHSAGQLVHMRGKR